MIEEISEGEQRKEKRQGNMIDWYDKNIEPGIKDLVKLLRDNGFNTYDSCHHTMTVYCEGYSDNQLTELCNLLIDNGYTEFKVQMSIYIGSKEKFVRNAREIVVMLPNEDGYFAN